MNQPIRIFIIDDHRLFRDTVAALASRREEIAVVGSAAGPDEALARVRSLPIDVVLVEATLKTADPVQMIWEIKETLPAVMVIVVGVGPQQEDVLEFIEAGANGYVLKDSSFAEMLRTIKAVHQGQTPCSPRITASVFARISELSRARHRRERLPQVRLTPARKRSCD